MQGKQAIDAIDGIIVFPSLGYDIIDGIDGIDGTCLKWAAASHGSSEAVPTLCLFLFLITSN